MYKQEEESQNVEYARSGVPKSNTLRTWIREEETNTTVPPLIIQYLSLETACYSHSGESVQMLDLISSNLGRFLKIWHFFVGLLVE